MSIQLSIELIKPASSMSLNVSLTYSETKSSNFTIKSFNSWTSPSTSFLIFIAVFGFCDVAKFIGKTI